jgi:uncharacterized protein (TIGR02246 family)
METMSTLSEVEITIIERACARLVLDFVDRSDQRDHEGLAALFAPDACLVRPNGESLIGRAAILESYRSRPAGRITRHICTNVRITVLSAERARGISYAVVYSANENAPPDGHFGVKADARRLVGEFEDEFVRTTDGWRFANRRCRFVMHTG